MFLSSKPSSAVPATTKPKPVLKPVPAVVAVKSVPMTDDKKPTVPALSQEEKDRQLAAQLQREEAVSARPSRLKKRNAVIQNYLDEMADLREEEAAPADETPLSCAVPSTEVKRPRSETPT